MTFQNNGYSPRSNSGSRGSYAPQEPPGKAFPKDYVDFAERYMKEHYRQITTSKLRNLLSLMMDVYNTEILRDGDTLLADSVRKLQMARIRMAYECGRDRSTKEFVQGAYLLPWLKDIGTSRERAIAYIGYMEALVAYHRFFGGREN